MATSFKSKSAAQPVDFTETAAPLAAQPQPVHADTDSMEFSLKDFLAMAGVQLPGWKRTLVSFIAALAAGYLTGSVASVLCNILFSGAIAITGSMFLAWALYSIGFIIALYCALKAGNAISRYILGGKVDDHASAAKDKVCGWFKFGDKEAIVAAA